MLSLFLSLALAAPPKVRKISETRYEVPESALNEAAASLNDVLQTARVVPYLEDGKFTGFRFQNIAKGSWFDVLGFQVNDVFTQVNDVRFDNPAKGLFAFQQLKNEKRWTVHLRRGAKKMKIRYDLVHSKGKTSDQRKGVGPSAQSESPKR